MITAVEQAVTGINVIDSSIKNLYSTGYMHNHFRMYTASVCCNIGKAHWLQPASWMYYHLLDGDLASNSLSWQWICAAFSSKKYYCNQENVNRYSKSFQQNTFLDTTYESLVTMPVPESLTETIGLSLKTDLPKTPLPSLNKNEAVLIYNTYNLDPLWHAGENANRILLLEPSHFKKYPVSAPVLQFAINLSKNIPGIQIFSGEFDELKNVAKDQSIIFKSHPAFLHYQGKSETYDYLFPEVSGYFPSFSAYWKKCGPYLLNR
jgi:deoxyribodipyrimidine photo-lyase